MTTNSRNLYVSFNDNPEKNLKTEMGVDGEEKAIRTIASHRADWTSPYTVKIFECDLRQMVILVSWDVFKKTFWRNNITL
jgi:hypothetical protein